MTLSKFNYILFLLALGTAASLYVSPKITYLEEIQIDGTIGELVTKYTKEFDERSNNSLLRKSFRKITISVGEVEERVMGYAAVGILSCEIVLSDRIPWQYMDEIYLRSTILHEILHCMGKAHVTDNTDIMYVNHDENIDEDSITRALVQLDKLAHF